MHIPILNGAPNRSVNGLEFWPPPLAVGENLVLVGFVVLARLEQDHVQVQVFHVFDRDLVHVVAPGKSAAATGR